MNEANNNSNEHRENPLLLKDQNFRTRDELISRIERIESSLKDRKAKIVPRTVRGILYTCLALGIICIGNSLAKT